MAAECPLHSIGHHVVDVVRVEDALFAEPNLPEPDLSEGLGGADN